jgi:hypothetical protein
LQTSPPPTSELHRADPPAPDADGTRDGENMSVDLGRLAWLGTVMACLVAVFVLVLEGYYGYAAVTFAVAISAGINLF